MSRTDVVVVGGGQAGLAMSASLSRRGLDHVVLERGEVGQRWRRGWDSLRLLTPNWMTRLPGHRYAGPDPEGFMAAAEVAPLLERYAAAWRVPVVCGATVIRAVRRASGFVVTSTAGTWASRQVVVATGHCDRPLVPAAGAAAPRWLVQQTPAEYRNPEGLPPGGVLIVGASATGVQLADELCRAGRPVTLAVGRHTRVPRRYRGLDLFGWFERLGLLRQSRHDVPDVEASRRQPSLQLVGRPTHESIDLGTLRALGVRVVGRLLGFQGDAALLGDDLVASVAAADAKLVRLLSRIDAAAGRAAPPVRPFEPLWPVFAGAPECRLDLRGLGVRTVIWATGYRRRYEWLSGLGCLVDGEIAHEGGVTTAPGVFALGLPFLRHRSSSFIDGVGVDAAFIARRIAQNLGHAGAAA